MSTGFPLSHLLYLYEIGASKDLYVNYFEGFKLLVSWLSPIEIPTEQPDQQRIYKLNSSYDRQEIAAILHCTQGQIENGYKTTIALLQQSANTAQLPEKISIVSDECKMQ